MFWEFPEQAANETIQISGSSTVYPITKAAIEDFQSSGNERTSFELRETGPAQVSEFCSGNIPLANASRPISSKELKRCKKNGIRFIELPIAFDAITVVVNPANTWSGSITVKELQRLWNKKAQGRINRWNQINLDYPDSKIKLCGPGKESGTFDIFNKTIKRLQKFGTDYLASEDDNKLVQMRVREQSRL